MKKLVILITVMTITLTAAGCGSDKTVKNITLSAASSLKEPLDEIAAGFEKIENIKINLNYGGSGVLQKQIEEGAPVDIFISAGTEQMDKLQSKGLIDNCTRMDLLQNELVLISSDSAEGVKSLAELGSKKVRLAIGEINTVPAGQYAKQSLENLKLWDKISSDIIYGRDVKDVLKYVQKGEVPAGIVYESDTVGLDKTYNIIKIPEDSHKPIIYPIAIMSNSKSREADKTFIEYIKNTKSKAAFEKYKFKVKD